VTNPLERLKILRQLGIAEYKSLNFFKAMARMWRTEGFNGFLKGNGANVVRVFPFTAFQFFFYEQFKLLLFPKGEKNSYTIKCCCGGLSGVITSTLTYPLDLVRTFLAIQTADNKTGVMGAKPGMVSGMVNIVKQNGFFGLYRGWVVSMIGVVPYLALQLSVFDWTVTNYMPDKKSKWFDVFNLCVGGWAGFVGAGLTYPLDVIRRKMQLSVM
jgi:solute carrier family 25 phosphate transporter 23/24/25/41